MGFKTLTVNKLKFCPECGGKKGLSYYIKVLPCIHKWGSKVPSPDDKEIKNLVKNHAQPMTAKCIDCGKRVNFKVNVPTCYECGKPRGKEKNGDFVCPCPECGNEDPF